jgi:hypothetical protein
MAEADIPAWFDSHWEAAAAEIEAGNCDDNGEIIPGPDLADKRRSLPRADGSETQAKIENTASLDCRGFEAGSTTQG